MPQLIEELIKDHEMLLEKLDRVKKMSIVKSEGQETLLSIKEGLLKHLKKEDEKLYPFLNEQANHDRNLRNTLDVLASEMDQITDLAITFFNKYTKVTSGIPGTTFAMDSGKLLGKLSARIRKEEHILYDEYLRRKS